MGELQPVLMRAEFLEPGVEGTGLFFNGIEFGVELGYHLEPCDGLGLVLDILGKQVGRLGLLVQLGLNSRFFFGVERLDAFELGLQVFQCLTLLGAAFMDPDGDAAVEFGAGDLFEDGRARIRLGLEERGEPALGQEHGACEPVEIHAGHGLDLFGHIAQFGLQDLAGFGVDDLVLRGLQLAIGLFSSAMLCPVAAEASGLGFEGDLGKAVAGLP